MTKVHGNRSLELTGARALLYAFRYQALTLTLENGVQTRPAPAHRDAVLDTLDELNAQQPAVADWWTHVPQS